MSPKRDAFGKILKERFLFLPVFPSFLWQSKSGFKTAKCQEKTLFTNQKKPLNQNVTA